MANYTRTTNFTTKDTLPSGDPNKIVRGSEHDTEYSAIAVAIATKADQSSLTTTNTTVALKANIASPTFTGTVSATTVNVSGTLTAGTINGGTF